MIRLQKLLHDVGFVNALLQTELMQADDNKNIATMEAKIELNEIMAFVI